MSAVKTREGTEARGCVKIHKERSLKFQKKIRRKTEFLCIITTVFILFFLKFACSFKNIKSLSSRRNESL